MQSADCGLRTPATPRHASAATGGFTLMELLVVIIIIGILTSLVLVGISGALNAAKQSNTETLIRQIQGALESYRVRWGDYPPTTLEEFGVKMPNTTNNGIEALTGCLSSQDRGGIVFQASDATQYGNVDNDKITKNACNWFFGDNQLREILDLYGRPLIYLHHKNYAQPTASMTTYKLGEKGETVTIKAAKTPQTKAFANPDKYQLFSAGRDGIPGNRDDIVGW